MDDLEKKLNYMLEYDLFCLGSLKQNPKLIEALRGKELKEYFNKCSYIDLDNVGTRRYNLAEFISEHVGEEEFFKICIDYGKDLDLIDIGRVFVIKGDITVESIRNAIDEVLYKDILYNKHAYSEDLPKEFKEKHPELFLPEELPENIKKDFYRGRLSLEEIRKSPKLKNILLSKDIAYGFKFSGENDYNYYGIIKEFPKELILDLALKYGEYFKIDILSYIDSKNTRIEEIIKGGMERLVFDRNAREYPYNENVPDFIKEKYPERFLDKKSPKELKDAFYDQKLNFTLLAENPEWDKFLIDKDKSFGFPREYSGLFESAYSQSIWKIGRKYSETVDKLVCTYNLNKLLTWHKGTNGKFLPNYVVIANFPENEIDNFNKNIKWWTQLTKLDRYNLNDDGKTALLKFAYVMGVFHGVDSGFRNVMQLLTGIPSNLSEEEFQNIIQKNIDSKENIGLFQKAYKKTENETYSLKINPQTDKKRTEKIRLLLEKANLPRILTPEKMHQMFDFFKMEYNPEFANFFIQNSDSIISNSEYLKSISQIQRQFKDIASVNSGRRLTLELAQNYVKNVLYKDVDVGNENLAKEAKIAGYSQSNFYIMQALYNEGILRGFSSIPKINGELNGYTYEMLRLDDPLALTIGTLTDCCQEINGAGQSSMEHSMISPDGRVFVVRDNEGRIVAQSWFWRNGFTGCFDNIEIPNKIFDNYEKTHPNEGRSGLSKDVLEVYKKAAKELVDEDEKKCKLLLENGTINKEQYEALLLKKITIGLGYNDIADAIKTDKTLHEDKEKTNVKNNDRFPELYTDAEVQYTVLEKSEAKISNNKRFYIHKDDVIVYDKTNISDIELMTLKKMENHTEKKHIENVMKNFESEDYLSSQYIINKMAIEYDLDLNCTKVVLTPRIAIIYSEEDEKKIIADFLVSPLKSDLTEEQKIKAQTYILEQIKKALKQIGVEKCNIDISMLGEEEKHLVKLVLDEIKEEGLERI